MIKTNRMKSISEIGRASKVVLERYFDCHTFCDEKWSRPKLTARLKTKEEGSLSYYRCTKVKETKYSNLECVSTIHVTNSTPRVASCIRHTIK